MWNVFFWTYVEWNLFFFVNKWVIMDKLTNICRKCWGSFSQLSNIQLPFSFSYLNVSKIPWNSHSSHLNNSIGKSVTSIYWKYNEITWKSAWNIKRTWNRLCRLLNIYILAILKCRMKFLYHISMKMYISIDVIHIYIQCSIRFQNL